MKLPPKQMAEYLEAGRLEDVPLGKGRTVTIAAKKSRFSTLMEPSMRWMILSPPRRVVGKLALEGKIVTCRGHGWRYDVTTGNTAHVPDYGVASYPVKVVDGKILVAVA